MYKSVYMPILNHIGYMFTWTQAYTYIYSISYANLDCSLICIKFVG